MDNKTDRPKDLKVDRKMDRWVRAIAGILVLVSVALGHYVNPWWLLLTAYVGHMQLQSAFTVWCPMEDLLDTLGVAKKNRKNRYFMKDAPRQPRKSDDPKADDA